MWEPDGGGSGSNSSSHSVSGNGTSSRGVILLLTALSACLLLYKAWGPLLFITCALVLVVHTCYSLLVNDSLLAPHTLVLLRYGGELGLELVQTLGTFAALGFEKAGKLLEYLRQRYDERNRRQRRAQLTTEGDDMNPRQRNVYRLSTTCSELAENVSPASNDPFHSFALNGACQGAKTSTPLPKGSTWRKEVQQNGDLSLFLPAGTSSANKVPLMRTENRKSTLPMARSEETLYSPKGSPWGNSISPKIREKGTGVKTVQTVAGPLLASTRYNIDPKIYTDVSSPGLTTRLTKYASEANNKLTHQPQYGTGQFPKVNLNASPIPILSPKVVRSRMPVTVRVAPPEIVNYVPSDTTHQERHKLFSKSSPEPKETKSCPNVAHVLKAISLKRHASREEKALDIPKKQRRARIIEYEELVHKRIRDESMTSEDELSPQAKTQRPTKRPKASSCHDILNSLSSSVNVLSGVKRKAMDTSRCNTPDIEKHFKPSSTSSNRSSPSLYSSGEIARSKEDLNVSVASTSKEPQQFKRQETSPDMLKMNKHSFEREQTDTPKVTNQLPMPKINKEISVHSKTENLTNKLFMRAEPQPQEKLKNLIEEQSSIEAKFATDDKDEIKKQDIVNMRQNSMRLRLQSMFDAISGKSASKIDPDVVIHAEEHPSTSTSAYTTLNSLTTTTTVNTSPITTTIVPILKTDTKTKSPNPKHVTFNLPSSISSLSSSSSTVGISTEVSKPEETKSAGFTMNAPTTFGFGSNITATSKPPSTASSFSFPVQSTATPQSIGDVLNSTTNVSNATVTASVPKTTADSVSTTALTSTGFTFGAAAKSTPVTTTTAPIISFTPALTTTTANSSSETSTARSSVLRFGNTPSTSPTSTTIAQPTITIPTFGSDKKTTGFSFEKPSIISSSIGTATTTAPSSTFMTTAATTSVNQISTQSTSVFGTSPMFSATGAGTTAPTTTTNPSTTSMTSSIFSFGSGNKPTTNFSFGGTTTTTAGPTSTFGTMNNVSSNTGTTTFASPTATPAANTPSSTFGSTTTSVFGAPASTSSLFSGSATSGATSLFKPPTTATTNPAANTAPLFGTQTASVGFGVPSTTTTPATPSLFGSAASANATTTASSTPSLFGSGVSANPATTSTTIPSLFGNTATTTSAFGGAATQQPAQGGIFANVNATTAATPSIFGSTASAAPTGLFSGANATSPSTNLAPAANPAESTSIFGQSKPPTTLTFGATSPSFGSSTPATGFSAGGTTAAPSFQIGAPASSNSGSLPGFNVVKPAAQFSQSTPATTGGGTTIFGSTSGFGAAASTTPSAFGGFGMQSAAATPTFSSGPSTQLPGQQLPTFSSAATTSPFGAQTTAAPTLFGNAAPGAAQSTGVTSGGSFTFGSTQTQQPQQSQQQPSASFSFGGTSNTNAGNTGGLFQFTGTATAKPAGFNFSAPSAAPTINFTGANPGAPPTFNAPAGNMFSIGSGSSTPRTRTGRQRRQR